MNELITSTASELAEALSSKEVSSEEVTRAHLDRIAEVDEQVHAFLHVNTEEALAVAREVDTARGAGTTPRASTRWPASRSPSRTSSSRSGSRRRRVPACSRAG
jgi:Asp-tRNA(Asn)/Glu-tRNA(Gln) amidotransferase A subunit family amidase